MPPLHEFNIYQMTVDILNEKIRSVVLVVTQWTACNHFLLTLLTSYYKNKRWIQSAVLFKVQNHVCEWGASSLWYQKPLRFSLL